MPGAESAVRDVESPIRSWGTWSVAGSIDLMVAHAFLPFPSEIVALANGMLYGPLWGTVITWIGAMLGALAAVAVGCMLGRPVLLRLLSPRGQEGLARWSREHGGRALLLGAVAGMWRLLNRGRGWPRGAFPRKRRLAFDCTRRPIVDRGQKPGAISNDEINGLAGATEVTLP